MTDKRKAAPRLRSNYDRDCIYTALRDYLGVNGVVNVREDGCIIIDSSLIAVTIDGRTVRRGQVVIRPQPRPWAAEEV